MLDGTGTPAGGVTVRFKVPFTVESRVSPPVSASSGWSASFPHQVSDVGEDAAGPVEADRVGRRDWQAGRRHGCLPEVERAHEVVLCGALPTSCVLNSGV